MKTDKGQKNDFSSGLGCFFILLGIALVFIALGIVSNMDKIIEVWK